MQAIRSQKTKVLFFAWGDSIHARRRIGIFCDDPSFEVGVVSNFAYDFKKAKNFYLTGALVGRTRISKLLWAMAASPLYLVLRAFFGVSLIECSNLLRDLFLVRSYVREFTPDVIFLQTLMYPCYASFLWLGRIPMLVTFWNGDVTWWAQWTGVERALKKKIVEYGVRKAHCITVNSRAALQACVAYGADERKVHLIRYPGVDLRTFRPSPDRSKIRLQLNLPSEGHLVFCPRGIGSYFNSDVIIEAAAEVIKCFPETYFIFFVQEGSRQEWENHLEQAAKLGITANIIAVGKIHWENMPAYYQASDVVLSMSSHDSLPNCMLEAMACGIPVIMGEIPQIQEWVEDNENGYTVPTRDSTALSDKIMRLFADDGGLNEIFIKKNIERVQRDVDSVVVSKLIRELIHNLASPEIERK